ncbi:MAG TPA: hypothetical protein PKW95_15405 [bacterium]|nr:hypothetical protein [bacterium]
MSRIRATLLDETLYAMSAVGEWHIGLVLAFAERLDETRLAEALRLTLHAEPLLAARLAPAWWRAHWEPPEQPPASFPLSVEPAGDEPPAAHRFFLEPMDHFDGPQVQALLLRGAGDTLLLKLSHFVTDAGGVKHYAYLLADIYRRLADDPHYRPPVNDAPRGLHRITASIGRGVKRAALRRMWREGKANPPSPTPLNPPGKLAARDERRFIARHVEPGQFAALRAWGRERELTINDVLVAAFLRALTQTPPDDQAHLLRIIGTVDLRRYLPADAPPTIDNLSGWVYANFGADAGDDLDATARLVGATMRQLKEGPLGLSMMPFLALLRAVSPLALNRIMYTEMMEGFNKENAFPPTLTNMGAIDPARLTFADAPALRAFLLPPLLYPPTIGPGVSGYGDTLTLSAGYCAAGTPTPIMEKLFAAWLDELP